jgi:alkylation response protein AidB-like acyl-CoA dehydrogenase
MRPRYESDVRGGSTSLAQIPNGQSDFRTEVKRFLADRLPVGWRGIGALSGVEYDSFNSSWRQALYEKGWLAVSWPAQYGGGGRSALEEVILLEEFTRAGVPVGGTTDTNGIRLLGNTLLAVGTEEQRQRFLPRLLSGEHKWCQGFSEPDFGSDLAGIRTRAVRDGDQWVINGQKVWTSGAHLANWIFVLARTDPDAERHRGMSFFLVPMGQEGLQVRPIRQMSGQAEFNEVFFSDVTTSDANVVGGVNEGWGVAMTMLGFERGLTASLWPIRFEAELDRLTEYLRTRGRNADPLVRQRVAAMYAEMALQREIGSAVVKGLSEGRRPGPESALIKLLWSEHHRSATRSALDFMGREGLTVTGRRASGPEATEDLGAPHSSASWVSIFLDSQAGTIYAGTSNIQRNIVAEKLLGLPKERNEQWQ